MLRLFKYKWLIQHHHSSSFIDKINNNKKRTIIFIKSDSHLNIKSVLHERSID